MYPYINQKDPKNDFVYGPFVFAEQYPEHPKDLTISRNGCGLCAATMAVRILTGNNDLPLKEIADLAVKWCYHYRNDMKVLVPVLAETYGLGYRTTNDPDKLLKWLNDGGVAIIHAAGNRKSDGHIGLVSKAGHYVTAVEAHGTRLGILDPSKVPGKYDDPYHKEHVQVDGDLIYVDAYEMADDCQGKLPYFYLLRPAREDD